MPGINTIFFMAAMSLIRGAIWSTANVWGIISLPTLIASHIGTMPLPVLANDP